jgi:hypothetical protein
MYEGASQRPFSYRVCLVSSALWRRVSAEFPPSVIPLVKRESTVSKKVAPPLTDGDTAS